MKNFIKDFIDWGAIAIGITTLILSFVAPQHDCIAPLTTIAAIICLGYIVYAISLICRGPLFDWHLFHGHFLRKVICLVLLMPFVLAFVIGVSSSVADSSELALSEAAQSDQAVPSQLWDIYLHYMDPGNQDMASEGSRGWAALIAILGVLLLNGLLVSSIIGWINTRKEAWTRGDVCYTRFLRFLSGRRHYVIIGGNDMVDSIVRQVLQQIECEHSCRKPYILIQTARDVERFRQELFTNMTEEQQQRIVIYYGHRDSEIDIENLLLQRAKEVYIIGEGTRIDDAESYHDTMNMVCLDLIHKSLSKAHQEEKLPCRVMFDSQATFSVFQFSDIDKKFGSLIDFKPFSYYELWAQKLFINREINPERLRSAALKGDYLPLDGCEGIKSDDESYVHLFIVGMSNMGIAAGLEAAHLAHYPNFEQKGLRTKITFIDSSASERKDSLINRYKELFDLSHWRYGRVEDGATLTWHQSHGPIGTEYLGGDFIDVEWEFINGGIEHAAIREYMLASCTPQAKVTIAICLAESDLSYAAGLHLDKRIYESDSVLQVLIYNRYGGATIEALHTDTPRHPYLNKLKSFGAPRDCFDMTSLTQGEEVGEAINSQYGRIYKEYMEPKLSNANSSTTAGGYKGKSGVAKFWSSIYNGNTMWSKLRSIGYCGVGGLTPDQIATLADVEHNRWTIEQLLMNFRPLTPEEQTDVMSEVKDKELLKSQMAHLNICSNSRLMDMIEIDPAVRAYDEGLSAILPDMYAQLTRNDVE